MICQFLPVKPLDIDGGCCHPLHLRSLNSLTIKTSGNLRAPPTMIRWAGLVVYPFFKGSNPPSSSNHTI